MVQRQHTCDKGLTIPLRTTRADSASVSAKSTTAAPGATQPDRVDCASVAAIPVTAAPAVGIAGVAQPDRADFDSASSASAFEPEQVVPPNPIHVDSYVVLVDKAKVMHLDFERKRALGNTQSSLSQYINNSTSNNNKINEFNKIKIY